MVGWSGATRARFAAVGTAALGLLACQTSTGGDGSATTEDCSAACAKIAAANCGDVGSGCVDACLRPPPVELLGDCPEEQRAFFYCFWAAPSFTCDASSATTPLGCDEELAAVLECQDPGGT